MMDGAKKAANDFKKMAPHIYTPVYAALQPA